MDKTDIVAKTGSKDKTSSSVNTILALYNNVLGGALLTFPILFKEKGLISSIIVLTVSAVISFVTCRIYVLHSTEQEKDVEWTINRILGKKWQNFFRLTTGLFILCIMVIEMNIIADQIYSIIILILDFRGKADSIAPKDAIEFGRFSIQWLTLIIAPFMFAYIFLRRISFLVRIAEYGSYMVFIYVLYVLVQFLVSAFSGQIDMDHIDWFSWDISGIAATCAYAFTMHVTAVTVLKQNKEQKNNERDVAITAGMGLSTYILVSVAGALATSGKTCTNTFVDCYITDWTILFVEIPYLFGRLSNYPITMEIGRTRVLNIFFPQISKKVFATFNVVFMVITVVICMLRSKLPIGVLMSIVGALVCYFFVYLLPAKLHFECLYSRRVRDEESLLGQSITSLEEGEEAQGQMVACNHDRDYVKRTPKYVRQLLHGGLNVLGVGIAIFDLYSVIKGIVED